VGAGQVDGVLERGVVGCSHGEIVSLKREMKERGCARAAKKVKSKRADQVRGEELAMGERCRM
jgi:hypothetical protein